MKWTFLYTILLLLLSPFAHATHIVGGEFELIHKRGYTYVLNLNLYFDDVNGNPAAEDDGVNVHTFDKKTNTWIETFSLLKITNSEFIKYTDPDCEDSRLRTRIIKYQAEVYLNPADYSGPEGYYLIWERCCRNNIIDNINDPGVTGMTFYMEFPPVDKENTSPLFKLPFGDYACVDELFEYDFSAVDPDSALFGDSLVYSLVTPLKGHSSLTPGNVIPPAMPAPYVIVSWLDPPYSLSNVTGNPSIPMQIDAFTGKLSVTPASTGLFVFSVLCEEFRGGVKIGAVRRDYQLLVIDCPQNIKPEINLQLPDTSAFYTEGKDTIVIYTADSTDIWCYQLAITDSNINENVTIKIIPNNFSPGIITLSQNQGIVVDTLKIDMCWDDCKNIQNMATLFIFDIMVQDSGCPVPKTSTLSVILLVIPEPNDTPSVFTDTVYIEHTDFDNPLNNYVKTITDDSIYFLIVDDSIYFNVSGTDPDSNFVSLYAFGEGFNLQDYGMAFNDTSGIGSVTSQFYWKIDCDKVEKGIYVVKFVVDDNTCIESLKDTITVKFIVRDFVTVDTFFVPNIFTPNGDGINDCFYMPHGNIINDSVIYYDGTQILKIQKFNLKEGHLELQKASCKDYFFEIEIYNRWGRVVFNDDKRDFKWCGEGFPDGVYFYVISFSESDHFKGTVTILR